MRAILTSLILFCVFLTCGCQQLETLYNSTFGPPVANSTLSPSFDAEKYSKVAVIVQSDNRRYNRSSYLRRVEDEFIQVILAKGYTIASRSDINRLKQEIKFQDTGWTDEDFAKAGRMLNVPSILLVNINDISNSSHRNEEGERFYTASATIGGRLIGVENAEILWIGSYSGSIRTDNSNQGERALAPTANVVASSFPDRVSTVE